MSPMSRKPCIRLELDPAVFMTEAELARRWRHSLRSLQRWRAAGKGPRAIRIGRRVVYRLSVVEAFEARQASREE
jgi:hypothetical protein